MAFRSRGSWGTGTRTAAGTSTTFTSVGVAAVGDFCVVACAKDNTGATDAISTEFTGCSVGTNTFTKAGEYRNNATGAATGTVAAVYFCKINQQVTAGTTVTVTHDNVADVALSSWRFSCDAQTVYLKTSAAATVSDTRFAGTSMSISNLVEGEYLFFRGNASEDESQNANTAATSNYTLITSVASTTSGAADANQFCTGEFRIVTATASTSNPTIWTSLAATQHVGLFFVFEEHRRIISLS